MGRPAAGARLRQWHDLLAALAAMARSPAPIRPDRLVSREHRWRMCPQPPGGQETGPNPTDRGKLGSKRHVLTDARGVPLAILVSGANRHDSMLFEDLIDAVQPVGGLQGRPKKRPDKVHADKGYDYAKCRRALRQRGIQSRIARRGVESSERLGRHRWVVERTHAWFAGV
ncbi:IS5 family transposase [Xanthomonas campestris pv. zinniae]|nr:IS5 family transposase [Xanthomonas campestris pv. zinniae]